MRTQGRVEAEIKLFSPLDWGQAFRPKPTRVLSYQNWADPIATSFCKIHMQKVKMDSQKQIVNIHSPMHIIAEVDFSPSRLDDSTNIFQDRQVFLFTWKNMERI